MPRPASTKRVIEALQKFFPKQIADSKWDNTGLLVDALNEKSGPATKTKVLLTIDLTTSVCDEAIAQNSDLIIAYHPFIFSGIKAINSTNPQHRSLMRLIQAGISVYCPHTAVDASTQGVNDWLADGVTSYGQNQESRETIELIKPAVAGHENAGYGRIVKLKEPIALPDLVKKVKGHLWMKTVQLVQAERHATEPISTIAICAGSGASVLSGTKADLWFTGELGHHQMLFIKESGTSAIVCGHSNTERGFLPVLRALLLKDLEAEGEEVEIKLAESDKDPIEYV